MLVFVLTSMLGMGFSLTIPQIIAPLRNTRLVLMSLAANFIIVPILVLLIAWAVPLSEGLEFGLILTAWRQVRHSCPAGAGSGDVGLCPQG